MTDELERGKGTLIVTAFSELWVYHVTTGTTASSLKYEGERQVTLSYL